MAYSGKYSPKNPSKYRGDPTTIIYRSLWERRMMCFFDENPDVLEWSSEEIVIPYVSPVDRRYHRYFVDFYVVTKTKDGSKETTLIEVKPHKQTLPPGIPKVKNRRFLREVMTWGVNSAKWKAATEYCNSRGWKFKILTEKEIT